MFDNIYLFILLWVVSGLLFSIIHLTYRWKTTEKITKGDLYFSFTGFIFGCFSICAGVVLGLFEGVYKLISFMEESSYDVVFKKYSVDDEIEKLKKEIEELTKTKVEDD